MMFTRHQGLAPLSQLRSEMERLWDSFVGRDSSQWSLERPWPPVNVWDGEDKVVVEAEVPGVPLDDLEILVDGSDLTLKGHRSEEPQGDAIVHRRERRKSEFHRSIPLPVSVEAENVEAALENGVLTVSLKKAAEVRPRRIAVKQIT